MKENLDKSFNIRDRVKSIKGQKIFKFLIVFGCLTVLVHQVSACIQKLYNRPVATYTHFEFNKTLIYPSVTFCREPPYKYEKLVEYELYTHPRFTSAWRDFDFDKFPLEQVWRDITYNQSEVFVQYGLAGTANNVSVTATVGFYMGTCFTLSPISVSTQASRATGYSITLRHNPEDMTIITGIDPPGYHVYIHYENEPFTEVEVSNGGLVDYLYVNTGEEVDVKLTVDEYLKINRDRNRCTTTNKRNYSANDCTTRHVWDIVRRTVGCSGPWMSRLIPLCNNYEQMRDLIAAYNIYSKTHGYPGCPRFCHSLLYNGFVTNRQKEYKWDSVNKQWQRQVGDQTLQTQLYIHFNSMMVSVYEERYTYDWNLFLSDLGGSTGFLLGLSVIGFIKMIEKTYCSLLRPCVKSLAVKKDEIEDQLPEDKTAAEEAYIEQYKEWPFKY